MNILCKIFGHKGGWVLKGSVLFPYVGRRCGRCGEWLKEGKK